jgi:CRISPR system Cascade subunit CasA
VRLGEEDSSAETTARLDLNSARSACREIEIREAAAQADLAALLGVSVSDLTTLRLPAYPSGLDLPGEDLLKRRRTTSLYTRPDIFKAISDYDRSENALRLAIASQYPQVRIGPGYIWERGLAKFPLTLSLVLPPADLNREAIRAAEARRAAAGASLEAVVATHYAAEQKALSDYEAALVLVQQIERQDLPITASQSKRAQDLKRLGEGTRADLLAAQAAQNSAQMRYEEARLAAGLARVQLEAVWRQPVSDEEMQSLKTLMQSLEVSP